MILLYTNVVSESLRPALIKSTARSRGRGPSRRLTFWQALQKVSKKSFSLAWGDLWCAWSGTFLQADDSGWYLPLFTKGDRRPLSLRSPGGASRKRGGKSPEGLNMTVVFTLPAYSDQTHPGILR